MYAQFNALEQALRELKVLASTRLEEEWRHPERDRSSAASLVRLEEGYPPEAGNSRRGWFEKGPWWVWILLEKFSAP